MPHTQVLENSISKPQSHRNSTPALCGRLCTAWDPSPTSALWEAVGRLGLPDMYHSDCLCLLFFQICLSFQVLGVQVDTPNL